MAFPLRHCVTNHCVCSIGCVALDALAAKAVPRNGHVSKIAYLLDLRGEVGVDAEQGFPPAPDSGVAAEVTAAIQLQVARDQLDVGVADREEGIEVSAAEGVSGSVLLLHVLLRHRLTQRVGGFEAFVRCPL